MSNFDDNDFRVSLAVLTAKFEAAQAQNASMLDAIKTLLLTEQANFRAAADARFNVIEKEVSVLKTGVEQGNLDRARQAGRAGVIAGVISVGVALGGVVLKALFGA